VVVVLATQTDSEAGAHVEYLHIGAGALVHVTAAVSKLGKVHLAAEQAQEQPVTAEAEKLEHTE
jgi:hypothetical protein